MNKNTVIGFVLIALIFIGFTWYNTKQYKKQVELQAQLDSIAQVEMLERIAAEPVSETEAASELISNEIRDTKGIYKDSLLELASSVEGEIVTLRNQKLEISFNSKGAQPYSAKLLEYSNYDGSQLYIFKEGESEYGISLYTGENINTKDFAFTIAEQTESSVTFRLAFAGGGYIEQIYSLRDNDSYVVDNKLSFVGMDAVVPRNVSVMDFDWKVNVPRMERGYKNESQYSKVDYYFQGEKKPVEIGRARNSNKRIENRLSWFAFQQQFFSAIMRSEQEFSSGSLSINFFPEEDESRNLMSCAASMRQDFSLGSAVYNNEFYFGPNHFKTLKSLDQKYEKIIPLGGWLVGWFTRFVIIPLFNFLHQFISNFGIIILLMTIFIKIVVLPFSFKSYSSSAKMQVLKPEIDKINAKYPKQEDAMKKQQATMDLYKRAGVSPMGGCLPMLLQFPILWAMFRFFPASIELRQQGFLWADDLSTYDAIIDFGTRIPLIGDHISLFALLMAVSMFFYSRITTANQPVASDPNMASMRFMSLYFMPIMMFFICNSLSAGLSYYYLLSNLITMLETWVIKKWFVHPEQIMAKLKASAGKPLPKSKWQQRLEEAQKMQQAQMKKR